MMVTNVHTASYLLKALEGLPEIRKGLKRKPKYDDPITLQIGAYEGDEDGGTGHGDVLIPAEFASAILDHLEDYLRAKLTSLGVEGH